MPLNARCVALAVGALTSTVLAVLPPCDREFLPFAPLVNGVADFAGVPTCYRDNEPLNPLFSFQWDEPLATYETCTAFCTANNFQYAGLKNGGDCYCGATFDDPDIDLSTRELMPIACYTTCPNGSFLTAFVRSPHNN